MRRDPVTRPEPADPALAAAAATARRVYVLLYREHVLARTGVPSRWGSRPMPSWDGGSTQQRSYARSAWQAVAELCLREGFDVAEYVASAFPGTLDRAGTPTANRLVAEDAIAAHRARSRAAAERAVEALAREEQRFTSEVRFLQITGELGWEEAARRALANRRVGLSALFRVAAAAALGPAGAEVARQWRDAAARQYAFAREAYDRAWGEKVPAEVREAAEGLLAGLRGEGAAR